MECGQRMDREFVDKCLRILRTNPIPNLILTSQSVITAVRLQTVIAECVYSTSTEGDPLTDNKDRKVGAWTGTNMLQLLSVNNRGLVSFPVLAIGVRI